MSRDGLDGRLQRALRGWAALGDGVGVAADLPRKKLLRGLTCASQGPRRARKRAEGGASSNVFSMFDQSQIQEFKEAFTIMDQNRDGFIDKEDLRDTFAALGRINVKNEELEAMVKEAPGPINFTVFLTMFGEKLKGTDPEETILHAFKVFDTEGKGFVKAEFIKEKLMTQADRFSEEETV
ncbi:myosin regulatory light chain 10 [Echinops telfairi]|uniref:Myosin regulatory light chain 10 n=1 Tax=Echinops telfairi TaxID=9371 RepID=A0ABM0IRH3_ECHTE|nr:myosin regulatory light chain 10 [Echinops telfairi]